jgi:hypothetical protein
MFFETPQVIGPRGLVILIVHALLNNLESYLLMSNSYILLVTNIDTKFWHLATEHDTLLKSSRNIFGEK